METYATSQRATPVAGRAQNDYAPRGEGLGEARGASSRERAGLAFYRLTAERPSVLTKRFELLNGELRKTSVAQLSEGRGERIVVWGLREFVAELDSLPPNAAITYGVAPGHDAARIVSQARATNGAITRTRRYFQFAPAPGVLMLDSDPPKPIRNGSKTTHPNPPNPPSSGPRDLLALLRTAAPCLTDASMLWRASASSGIYTTEGEALTGVAGQRVYIPVADASLIPAAGTALVDLLWASGYGRIEIGVAGQALERTAVDASVWQPERMDFAASPVLGPGLRRDPPSAFIDGDPDALFDLRRLIAQADGDVKARAATARKSAHAAAKAEVQAARNQWVEEQAPELAKRRGIDLGAAQEVLRRACEHGQLTGNYVLHCADGTTPTVGDLLDNPAKWHGQKFADPLEPDYGQDRRIAWANLRSGGRPWIYSHAHGGRRYHLIRPSARIRLAKAERARVIDAILDLMRAQGDLYDYGDGAALARVTDDARALPVTRDWLVDHLDRAAVFYTLQSVGEGMPPKEVPTDAPTWAPSRLIAKDGERRLPRLDAVITAPILRADGSILSAPGHDAASRLLLLADTPDMPHIPPAPTTAEARAALEMLWAPFRLFPLVDAVDRGVILAALLCACVRASLPTAPGTALDAPTAGTGKTLLGLAIGALSLGYAPPALPPAGNQDEEARKRLFAALRDGHRVLLWDNVREPLGNGALDAFLTAPTFTDRILGKSETATLPNRVLFLVTGNNLRLVGDTCRRILPARLDARIERPYAREFDFCPRQTVLARRMDLVIAALTIIRAWITAGRPRHGKGRTASFEGWDELVRQPVCWIAKSDARFADPLKATERAFDLDPETAKLAALIGAWDQTFASRWVTTGELASKAEAARNTTRDGSAAVLLDAVEEIAGDPRGSINRRMLGRWIERHAERRHNDRRLVRGKLRHGAPTWCIAKDADPAGVGLGGLGGFNSTTQDNPGDDSEVF